MRGMTFCSSMKNEWMNFGFCGESRLKNGAEFPGLRIPLNRNRQYFLSHINKNLFSWGVIQKGELAAIGSFCLFTGIPYREVQFESV